MIDSITIYEDEKGKISITVSDNIRITKVIGLLEYAVIKYRCDAVRSIQSSEHYHLNEINKREMRGE